MKTKSKFLCALLTLAMVFTFVPISTFALSGDGHWNNPYIVNTYDELRQAMARQNDTYYVKLGSDIVSNDSMNQYNLGISTSNKTTINLDLAGHTVSRTALTLDQDMVVVGANYTLNISDSVGGGGMYSKLSCGAQTSHLFRIITGGSLIINGGKFETVAASSYSNSCVLNQGGDFTMNGGQFIGKDYAVKLDSGSGLINAGIFEATDSEDSMAISFGGSSEFRINNCTVITPDASTCSAIFYYKKSGSGLKDFINSDATITVDGKKTTLDGSESKICGEKVVIAQTAVSFVTIRGDYSKDCTKLENVSCTIEGVNVPAAVEVKYVKNKTAVDALIPGSSMQVGFYVTLPDGYVWSDSRTSSWNGAKPDGVVKTSTMTDSQRAFVYNVTVPKPAAAPYVFPFVDVPESQWYYEWVKGAHQMGLINGKTETTYCPNDNMTYAEAIKLAACMHQKYTTGSVTLTNGSPNWYDSYVDYCLQNGIIKQKYSAVINSKIDRQSYAAIFAKALPARALSAINIIPTGSIPDVSKSSPNYDAIYTLYRAGIVNGSDSKGSFNPTSNIKRSEVAAILMRMMDESVRVGAPADLST